MEKSEQPSWELPDSEKTFADIMREAAGGRKAGLRTEARTLHKSESQLGGSLLRNLVACAKEPKGLGALLSGPSVYVFMMVFSFMLVLYLATSVYELVGALLVCVWILTMIWVSHVMEAEHRSHVRSIGDRLRSSPVIEKILLGPRELGQIYDWTPRFWSTLFLGPRPGSFKGWLRLLANNLDWYMGEPRPLYRLIWALATAYFAVIAAVMVLLITSLSSGESVSSSAVWLAFLACALVIKLQHEHSKKRVTLIALGQLLKERFGDTSEDTQT